MNSNDHRQGREAVKQKFLRGSVQNADESGANVALFVLLSTNQGAIDGAQVEVLLSNVVKYGST